MQNNNQRLRTTEFEDKKSKLTSRFSKFYEKVKENSLHGKNNSPVFTPSHKPVHYTTTPDHFYDANGMDAILKQKEQMQHQHKKGAVAKGLESAGQWLSDADKRRHQDFLSKGISKVAGGLLKTTGGVVDKWDKEFEEDSSFIDYATSVVHAAGDVGFVVAEGINPALAISGQIAWDTAFDALHQSEIKHTNWWENEKQEFVGMGSAVVNLFGK